MNGIVVDREPLPGWAIVQTQGLTLLGRLGEGPNGPDLSPVYELNPLMQPGEGGNIMIAHMARPVFVLGSVRRLPIPPGALVIRTEELSTGERRSLHAAAEMAAKLVDGLRAAASGIAVAPAGTKLPPMRGV